MNREEAKNIGDVKIGSKKNKPEHEIIDTGPWESYANNEVKPNDKLLGL